MLILFKMKTRWHHLVTYTASRCLPPPQPQLMSTPLSYCLVDCYLLLSSASSISSPPPSPLYCHALLLLLHLFSVKATYFSASSPSPPASPPPSPSPSYLHRILFDCCVLRSSSLFVVALSLFRLLLLFNGAAATSSVNLPQPSSTSSSKPPLSLPN